MYDFRKHVRPDEAQIDKALPAVNYRHVMLDPANQTVQFSQKGVRIDLGGIAKGYSVDRGIEVLQAPRLSPAPMSARAATAASSAIASASPGSSASAIRARARAT